VGRIADQEQAWNVANLPVLKAAEQKQKAATSNTECQACVLAILWSTGQAKPEDIHRQQPPYPFYQKFRDISGFLVSIIIDIIYRIF
jgi:hypothetical protein